MASTNYPKNINVANFANGIVDAGRLSFDIENYIRSSDQLSITIVLDSVDIVVNEESDDICNIWFKADLSTDEQSMLDAICLAHTGDALPAEVTSVTLEPTGSNLKDLQAVGVNFEADLNTSTEHLVGFAETREVQGVSVELKNHIAGFNKDSMEIAIVAPDGVGGWVAVRHLVRGEENYKSPVPPSGITHVVAEGTAAMPTMLRIRVIYHSTATTGEKPYIYLLFRTWK